MSTPSHLDNPTRRHFIMQGLTAAGGALLGGHALAANDPFAGAPKLGVSDTLATTLFKSLNDQQRTALCFPWDDKNRERVENNWHITKQPINKVLDKDQQAMVREIFDQLHSEEYKHKVWEQFDQDNKGDGGFGSASIAMFGEPGTGKFSFALTGRHCTRRCDGDLNKGAVFGGPIFYGHAAKSFNEDPTHEGNVYWYQAKRANAVFAALDGKQREKALRPEARGEAGNGTVKLTGLKTGLEGIPMTDLTADQKDLVKKVLADLLLPFRKQDSDEAMRAIEKNGFDNLHMAFFKKGDLGNDGIWDNWILEGPSMVWYFRGTPHVHCWAHIRDSAKA